MLLIMPQHSFQKRRAHKGKKRGQRKNRRNKAATAPIGRSAEAGLRYRTPLFPPRFKKNLVYVETGLTVTGTTGLVGNYFFSANGMFDPNVTGTGHQPMGFDQMMLMYEQYTVTSSKITVTYINGSGAGVYADVGLYLSPDTTSITNPSQLMENGFFVWKPLNPINVQGSIGKLNLTCNVATYFARAEYKRELLQDPELHGTAAANPVEQVYFTVCAFDGAGGNTVTISFTVEIEYEVMFSEPRKLTQS